MAAGEEEALAKANLIRQQIDIMKKENEYLANLTQKLDAWENEMRLAIEQIAQKCHPPSPVSRISPDNNVVPGHQTDSVVSKNASSIIPRVSQNQPPAPVPVQTQRNIIPTPVQAQRNIIPTPVQTQRNTEPTPVQTQRNIIPSPVQTQRNTEPTPVQTQRNILPAPLTASRAVLARESVAAAPCSPSIVLKSVSYNMQGLHKYQIPTADGSIHSGEPVRTLFLKRPDILDAFLHPTKYPENWIVVNDPVAGPIHLTRPVRDYLCENHNVEFVTPSSVAHPMSDLSFRPIAVSGKQIVYNISCQPPPKPEPPKPHPEPIIISDDSD